MNEKKGISIQKQRFFALCGIIAPMLFTILVIIESLLRPGYSQIYNFVSDLGVGPNAVLQNINFAIFGILSIFLLLGFAVDCHLYQGRL